MFISALETDFVSKTVNFNCHVYQGCTGVLRYGIVKEPILSGIK